MREVEGAGRETGMSIVSTSVGWSRSIRISCGGEGRVEEDEVEEEVGGEPVTARTRTLFVQERECSADGSVNWTCPSEKMGASGSCSREGSARRTSSGVDSLGSGGMGAHLAVSCLVHCAVLEPFRRQLESRRP